MHKLPMNIRVSNLLSAFLLSFVALGNARGMDLFSDYQQNMQIRKTQEQDCKTSERLGNFARYGGVSRFVDANLYLDSNNVIYRRIGCSWEFLARLNDVEKIVLYDGSGTRYEQFQRVGKVLVYTTKFVPTDPSYQSYSYVGVQNGITCYVPVVWKQMSGGSGYGWYSLSTTERNLCRDHNLQ